MATGPSQSPARRPPRGAHRAQEPDASPAPLLLLEATARAFAAWRWCCRGEKASPRPQARLPAAQTPAAGSPLPLAGRHGENPSAPGAVPKGASAPQAWHGAGVGVGGASECVPPLPPSPRTWQRAEGHLSPSARGAVPSGSERGASSPRVAPCQLPAAVPAPSPLARGCRAGRRLGAPRDSSQAARALSSCPEEGGGTARKVLGWPISGALQPAPPTPSPWWVCGTGWVPAPLLGFRAPQRCCLSQLCFRTCLPLPLHPEASLRPARHRRGRG